MESNFGKDALLYSQMVHILGQVIDKYQYKNITKRYSMSYSARDMCYKPSKFYRIDWHQPCTIRENPVLYPAILLRDIGFISIRRNKGEATIKNKNYLDHMCTSVNFYVNGSGVKALATVCRHKDLIVKIFNKDEGLILI